MPDCKFCGPQFDVTKNNCPNCGKSLEENFDDQQNLQQFAEIVVDSFFEIEDWQTQDGFLKSTQRVREKLLISYNSSVEQFNNLKKYFDEKQPLSEFQLEFNQNVIDAYAGHDTYLQFRFTNKSALGDNYKVYIFWDDRETEDEDDLHIRSNTLIKPNQSIELGGTHIFMRAGPKEISELTITVTNQFKDEAKFKVTPFNFRVKTPTQNVINQITTKNEISIEGRGVVDAANMGGQNPVSTENNEPQWINLEHFLLPDEVKNIGVSNPSNNTNNKKIDSYCSECGEPSYDPEEVACTHCNLAHAIQTDPSQQIQCEQCGNSTNGIGDNFCFKCGAGLISNSPDSKTISEGEINATQSKHKLDNGDLWSGEFNDAGLPHGKGTYQVIKKDGEWIDIDLEFYIGEMHHGEMYDLSGSALIKYRGIDWYEGTVVDGKPHGWGLKTFIAREMACYRGMYAFGMRHGLLEHFHMEETDEVDENGVNKYIQGEFIQGESWHDDQFHAEGYYEEDPWYRIAGDNTEGRWLGLWSNKRDDGRYNFWAGWNDMENKKLLSSVIYGDFDGMQIRGLDIDDGSVMGIYNGDIDNNLRNGFGTYYFPSYEYQRGNWINDKLDGAIEIRSAGDDPKINVSQWRNGKKINTDDETNVPIDEVSAVEGNDTHKIFEYPVDPVSATIWNHCYFDLIYEIDRHYWDYEWWNFLGHDLDLAAEIESGGMGRKVITDKKRKNVYESIKDFRIQDEQIILVYDDTVFGSCKDFILFTNKSFWAKGINQPLVRYDYNFIKKVEPTGKKLKLYLSDNTTYSTNNTQINQQATQMHADLLNKLASL